MKRRSALRCVLASALTAGLLLPISALAQSSSSVPASAAASEEGAGAEENAFERSGEVAMDVLVLRPFGALSTLVGGAFLMVATPLLVPGGEYEEAREMFFSERARYTFDRPLGRF
jgi:hypothetical protein